MITDENYEEMKLRIDEAVKAVKDDIEANGFTGASGSRGKVRCPVCESGKIWYIVHRDSTSAICSTPDCVRW